MNLEPDRLAAARAFAQWHIGDPNWADLILQAYNDDPVQVLAEINRRRDA